MQIYVLHSCFCLSVNLKAACNFVDFILVVWGKQPEKRKDNIYEKRGNLITGGKCLTDLPVLILVVTVLY